MNGAAGSGSGFDPQVDAMNEQAAIIYAPRPGRDRLPENCVTPCPDDAAAIAAADARRHLHPARVRGPCISSEGIRVYYLVRWLSTDRPAAR